MREPQLRRTLYGVDDATWRELKSEAAKAGLTVSRYVLLALRLMLKQRKEAK